MLFWLKIKSTKFDKFDPIRYAVDFKKIDIKIFQTKLATPDNLDPIIYATFATKKN
jgi:hypothetical protein